MKINWNKRYTTYAIYASIIAAAVIFCIFVGVYIKDVWTAVTKVADVFAPLFYGCVIAYVLSPLANIFERKVLVKIRHGVVRRGISVFLTYSVFLTGLGLLLYAVIPQIGRSFNDLQANLALYSQSIQEWLNSVSQRSDLFAAIVNKLNEFIDFDSLSSPITKLIQLAYDLITNFSPFIVDFVGSFVVQLKNILIGLVFSGYILCSRELVFAQINKLMHVVFSKERIERFKKGVAYADKTFGKYLMGTFLDAIMVGILTAAALLIFRMPYVPLISVLIACTNIIPIFGPFIGAIPSFLFIFISNPLKALWFVVIILVIQQIDGNLIAPRILGNSTGLPAMFVIIAITVMGGLFGVGGMIIGVPVFAILGKLINDKTTSKIRARKAASEKSIVDDQISFEYEDEEYDEFDYYYDDIPRGPSSSATESDPAPDADDGVTGSEMSEDSLEEPSTLEPNNYSSEVDKR